MTREMKKLMPEARRDGLVVQELSGEVLVYDLKRNKAHCLNSTAALVWEYCDGKTSVTGIARAIEGRTNGPVEEDLVWLGVEQLSKSDLLRERATLPNETVGLSRREVMKRIGLAAAVALPVVTSIIAPSAVQAATCIPSGQGCTGSAQCCSGVCSGGTCA
ncbi:MAG TPA: PqqD family peptide modification chaperone [Blastocatellia bacterium]|nr:PqqD family peptide modification chaperone [Blastocatellia bacterium]